MKEEREEKPNQGLKGTDEIDDIKSGYPLTTRKISCTIEILKFTMFSL